MRILEPESGEKKVSNMSQRNSEKHQRDRISVEAQRQDGRSASGAVDGAAGHPRCGRPGALRDAGGAGAAGREAPGPSERRLRFFSLPMQVFPNAENF
jgi:hypothetical protein